MANAEFFFGQVDSVLDKINAEKGLEAQRGHIASGCCLNISHGGCRG